MLYEFSDKNSESLAQIRAIFAEIFPRELFFIGTPCIESHSLTKCVHQIRYSHIQILLRFKYEVIRFVFDIYFHDRREIIHGPVINKMQLLITYILGS